MRRLLILLLVLVVPLKAWAAVALPHAAGKEHPGSLTVQHAGQAAQAHADPATGQAEDDCCPDYASSPHSHDCPHLTMPLLVHQPLVRAMSSGALERPAAAARPLTSVVLEVPLPPPLLLH